MYDLYLVTGATGNLGSAVVWALLDAGARVRALALPGDGLAQALPRQAALCFGNVEEPASMEAFFADIGENACLIHCAGVVSIASRPPASLWRVNVQGTENVLKLCLRHKLRKVVYVSSVHAIPVRPRGETIREVGEFSPDAVRGQYAKSKAAASALALRAARQGLDISIVHPSGILSPADGGRDSISATILAYCRGRLPLAVRGGYDFVDVRDVAQGILACTQRGRAGECYILSGQYASLGRILGCVRKLVHSKPVLYLPLWLVRLLAPALERRSLRRGEPLFLTPDSVYTLASNAAFSREKAERELGFCPRSLEDSLRDMVRGFLQAGLIQDAAVKDAAFIKNGCPAAKRP